MWRIIPIEKVPKEKLDVSIRRFSGQKVLLYELLDDSYMTKSFFRGCVNVLSTVNNVINKIKYPLTSSGQPTDLHYYQAFRKWLWTCHKTFRNDYDYWQFAWETIWLGYGDCEDTSILCGSGLELLMRKMQNYYSMFFSNIKSINYYVVLGAVFKDERLLGYHGWVIVLCTDNNWHLVETTLDTPYTSINEIPVIDFDTNMWYVGDIMYEGYIIFNKREYGEWYMSEKPKMSLQEWLKIKRKMKECKKKYKALQNVYKKFNKKLKVKV